MAWRWTASGNVFVADYGNNAVKEILAAGGYTTVNTLGSGFNWPAWRGGGRERQRLRRRYRTTMRSRRLWRRAATPRSTPWAAGSASPSGVAVDGSGNVFVADTGNNAVKEILAAGGYTTVNTLGSGFS